MNQASSIHLAGAYRRHLPRGRSAGRQTIRRRIWTVATWIVSIFSTAAAIAALPQVLDGSSKGLGALAALIPFVFSPFLTRGFRGGSPTLHDPSRRARAMGLHVESTSTRRGESLLVTVASRRGATAPAGTRVGLVSTTWADRFVMQLNFPEPMRSYEQWRDAGPDGTARLTLPPDVPFSYEGRNLSTAWVIVAQLPSGRIVERPIWIDP